MARIKGISDNLNAFLDTIGYSEGTSTSSITKDGGYDIIVTGIDGKERFTDYSQHPFVNRKPKQINSKGLYSSASGKYQHMRVHWEHYRDLLKLPDFSPVSQDKWAIQLIKERKALPLIEAGKFIEAVAACSNLWASFPGAGYGQSEHDINKLLTEYLNFGGKLWESKQSSVSLQPQLSQSVEPLPTVELKEETKPIPTIELQTPTKPQNGLWQAIMRLLKRN